MWTFNLFVQLLEQCSTCIQPSFKWNLLHRNTIHCSNRKHNSFAVKSATLKKRWNHSPVCRGGFGGQMEGQRVTEFENENPLPNMMRTWKVLTDRTRCWLTILVSMSFRWYKKIFVFSNYSGELLILINIHNLDKTMTVWFLSAGYRNSPPPPPEITACTHSIM